MRKLLPDEIREAVKGRWRWRGDPFPTYVGIDGVSTDTRSARPGDLFIALRGSHFDGHRFLAQAAEAGCRAAIVLYDYPVEDELLKRFAGGVIGVADTTAALGDLARGYRAGMSAVVVAVTGSNGKTTVKRMIHHVLGRRWKGTASPKSFNNNVGVPLTLLGISPDDDYVVCELGTNAPGEIACLARITRPDVAVITSVSPTHLEKLIDLDHVAAEKASLLGELGGVPNPDGSGLGRGSKRDVSRLETSAPPEGLAVIWADSEPLARAVRSYQVRTVRFGQADDADLRLTDYQPTRGGGRFELNGRIRAELSVPGLHNALNALAAVAVAQRFGFAQEESAAALADYRGEDMRLQAVRLGQVTLVNDAYNANPASMRAAADAMASFNGRRRVLVAGDMLELGEKSVELHRDTGRAIAASGVNLLVGVGKLGRHIAAGAAEAGLGAVEEIESVEAAERRLPKLLKNGDVVLLKGSRGMAMERLVEPIRRRFAKKPAGTSRRRNPSC